MPDGSSYEPSSSRTLDDLLTTAPAGVARQIIAATTIKTAGSPESIKSIFMRGRQLQAVLRDREQALRDRDWLEADLLASIGYPRVRLPPARRQRDRYAGDPATIDRSLSPARHRLRQRLKAELHERQRAWTETADATGLTEAIAAEDARADVLQR